MPLPHFEPRIAPKLCQCLGKNTHIESLILTRSNLQKPQGPELAESMGKNHTIKTFDISLNALDSLNIKKVADQLLANDDSAIEVWRFGDQLNAGQFLGRPVEETVAQLCLKHTAIVKLGFAIQDAHWRDVISRALLKNCDAARRKRKGGPDVKEPEEKKSKEKPFIKILINTVPEKALWEVFEDDDPKLAAVCSFVAEKKVLPTKEQLQKHASAVGCKLPFSAVAPLLKDWRARLLNASVGNKWGITDTYGTLFNGQVKAWTEKNSHWEIDLWPADGSRFKCTATKDPTVDVSNEVAIWMKK